MGSIAALAAYSEPITMGIGYNDGYLSPGHDVMPGAWVGTIKSQLAQSLYKLTP